MGKRMESDTILAILSALGIGGIVGSFFTSLWQRMNEVKLRENELKQTRYRATLLLMHAMVNPKHLKNLQRVRPEIRTLKDLREELETEWVSSWIFASDETIITFKNFLNTPSDETFSQAINSMRKELWGNKSWLPATIFSLKN